MFYVGLDVHATQITVCVLKNNGKVHKRWTVRELYRESVKNAFL
ncbi:hypothetical protein [Thalassoglobus polymorphus]|uniref:Transposase n=1 Tax=Thalassoglobus polymorphus TaxID=2527994 RepID=A0A517QVJ4_9PLAN|nr:hypothetical protein [Thalassoglobus polymorphus]QDT35631.1 hypothetical protein Mal48_49090 [Thalassoglobus polymorphus]